MKIVVFVKHVPDADSDRRIEDGRLVRGEDDALNELDEYAIEEAVSLVEEHGGEVVAVTVGPEDAHEAVFRALQMGAARGVQVTDDAIEGADALGTAAVLARVVADEAPDFVFSGMASMDGMTSLVPPAVAAELDWPLLDVAEEVDVDAESLRVTIRRHTDGYAETLSASAPAVVTVTDQINEPRYPSFKTMRAARSKPVDEVEVPDLDRPLATVAVRDAAPREREAGVIINDSGDAGIRLAEFLKEKVGL